MADLFLELQRLAGGDVRLLAFRHAPLPPPPDFWLDFSQRHFLETEGLVPLGHGAIGTVYDVSGQGQVLKESRCAIEDLVPAQGIFWHQTRFASSAFARSATGVVPLLRYGFRRVTAQAPLLAGSVADGPYSRYRQAWEHRAKSLLVMQTLWPKAQGSPLSRMLRSPAAVGLPQVLVQVERVISEMHAAGYAHNDLHAGNILVQGPQQVTVIDYDLVRPASADSTFGDYLSLACLTFDANHMQLLEKFFPEGGVRTKLASAGLERLPRLRHYAHVGRWEPLGTLDLLLFQRQHLQLLGLDPAAVSYEVEYHLPPHVTIALLASTTHPRAFRAVLERVAPAPVVAAAASSQATLRLPLEALPPCLPASRQLLLPSQRSSTRAKQKSTTTLAWPAPRMTCALSERGPEPPPGSDERGGAAPTAAAELALTHKRTRSELGAEAARPASATRWPNTWQEGSQLRLRWPGRQPV